MNWYYEYRQMVFQCLYIAEDDEATGLDFFQMLQLA